MGRNRRQADGRFRADRDARCLAQRTTGVDRLVAETAAADLPKGVPTFEQAIACFRELGLGCNVEIKPCEGPGGRDGQGHGRDLAALLAGPQLPPPAAVELRRLSLATALQAAPEFDRAILLGEIGDDWCTRTEAVVAKGVNTNGKKLTAPRAVEIVKAGLCAQRLHDQRRRCCPRFGRHGGCTASSPMHPM